MSRILFVDDSPQILEAIRRMLRRERDLWEIVYCDNSPMAWEILLTGDFDVAVLDVRMPHLSGLELLQYIKATDGIRDIPVVMLTGLGDCGLKRQALQLGAADLLNKPVEREDLIARIESALRLKDYEDRLRRENVCLEATVQERTAELFRSRLDVVWRLGKAAEYRDNDTGNHVIRVGYMARAVAEHLGMDREFAETLFVASPLHDIGKVGIPDTVLLKRGPLSPAERHVMMRHCWIGERILKEEVEIEHVFSRSPVCSPGRRMLATRNPLIDTAAQIALTHHEKWDGTGYPQGLIGEAIPMESRITAIVDVFDALTSWRPYKPPFSEERALSLIADEAGNHFDRQVHRAFEQSLPELRTIRTRLCDHGKDSQGGKASSQTICRSVAGDLFPSVANFPEMSDDR